MIVVTGAGGFIGRNLVASLVADRQPVRILRRDVSRATAEPVFDHVESGVLPDFGAPDAAFADALQGATAVVHCAALNSGAAKASEQDFLDANAVLTGKIGRAASAIVPGRFVYLSSTRAVAGPEWSGAIDEATPAHPSTAYGRSKLEGERHAFEAFAESRSPRATILRLAPVYGVGMGGALLTLARLAALPIPLPLGGLSARQSLLSVDAAVRAVRAALDEPAGANRTYVVGDREPIAVSGILRCFRDGLGRSPGLVGLPPAMLKAAIRLLGLKAGESLFASQICDPSALARVGWRAERESCEGLRKTARAMKNAKKAR